MDKINSSNFPHGSLRSKLKDFPGKSFQVSTPSLHERDGKVIRQIHEPESFLSTLGKAALGLVELGLVSKNREYLKPIIAFNSLTNNGLNNDTIERLEAN